MWKWLIWLIFFREWDEDWMGGRWDLSGALPAPRASIRISL